MSSLCTSPRHDQTHGSASFLRQRPGLIYCINTPGIYFPVQDNPNRITREHLCDFSVFLFISFICWNALCGYMYVIVILGRIHSVEFLFLFQKLLHLTPNGKFSAACKVYIFIWILFMLCIIQRVLTLSLSNSCSQNRSIWTWNFLGVLNF